MAAPSTKQKLLSLVEDVEIVSKELFEVISTPKSQHGENIDTSELLQLLIQKDRDIKTTLKTADEQAEYQKKMDALKSEVDKRDQDIRQLQKNLKEAETILASAIYQAKQKLATINQAGKRKLSSEELIKYAHKISSSNAVAAPPAWAPGDHRRPYPTELDMRRGWLGNIGDLHQPLPHAMPDPLAAQQAATPRTSLTGMERGLPGQASSLSWQPNMDIGSSSLAVAGTSQGHPPAMDTKGHNKENEDVEIMSSDSSSSSSSDE